LWWKAEMRRRDVCRSWLGLTAVVAASGCGFHPLYMPTASGKPGVASRELAAIYVNIIPDRPGQLLRQALQDRFEGSGSGVARLYDLSVSYSIGGEGIAIQPDTSVTRVRLTGRADWILRSQDPSRTLLSRGNARSVDAVNVLNEQFFAADLETEVVQRRIADAIADQITAQIATFFVRRANQTASAS
jgi:LPS-assembly lipoprotein